jgi:hypothetical protein
MDNAISNIVHASIACIGLEALHRKFSPAPINGLSLYWTRGGYIFFYSYTFCLLTQLMEFKNLKSITTSSYFRWTLSFLHGLDGLAALFIGISIYYESEIGLWISSVMITKFFLIHLLNRLILAKKSDLGILAECTQTTKSFLHHVSSFLFICHPTEIIITALWRTISMTGHATLVLRGRWKPETISTVSWFLAYMRVCMVLGILVICYLHDDVRDAFGRSAVGHVSYMMVRAGPVFKTGSIYLTDEEKLTWSECSDGQKILHLLKGTYLMLSIELALLVCASAFFMTMRVSTFLRIG